MKMLRDPTLAIEDAPVLHELSSFLNIAIKSSSFNQLYRCNEYSLASFCAACIDV